MARAKKATTESVSTRKNETPQGERETGSRSARDLQGLVAAVRELVVFGRCATADPRLLSAKLFAVEVWCARVDPAMQTIPASELTESQIAGVSYVAVTVLPEHEQLLATLVGEVRSILYKLSHGSCSSSSDFDRLEWLAGEFEKMIRAGEGATEADGVEGSPAADNHDDWIPVRSILDANLRRSVQRAIKGETASRRVEVRERSGAKQVRVSEVLAHFMPRVASLVRIGRENELPPRLVEGLRTGGATSRV